MRSPSTSLRHAWKVACFAALCAVSTTASATTDPPLSIRPMHDPYDWPVQDQVFHLDVQLLAAVEGSFDGVTVSSGRDPQGAPFWEAVNISVVEGQLTPDVPLDLTIDLIGHTLHEPLEITFDFEGRKVGREFFLTPYLPEFTQVIEPGSAGGGSSGAGDGLASPDPVPDDRRRRHPHNDKRAPSDDDLIGGVTKGRSINCHGRFVT